MRPAGRDSEDVHTRTMASGVYARLREHILNGHFAEGAKIRIEGLVAEYGIGATPVREALNRLATEGLLNRHDQRGFSAKSLSSAELAELTRTRCWLEETGLRQSIAGKTAAWEEQLVLALHRLTRFTPQVEERPRSLNDEWRKLHDAFHRALISGCRSHWLINYCGQLSDQMLRYRVVVPPTIDADRDCMAEHELIASAALDGDADRAVTALVHHLHKSAEAALNGMRRS